MSLCESNNLIFTNTCFSHKQSHLTSWQQTKIDKETNKVQHVRKVLDYIIIEEKFRHLLTNSRTYQGTLTISDNRLLIATMQIGWYLVYKNKNETSNNKKEKFNTQKLVNEVQIQQEYKRKLQERFKAS